MGFLYKFFRILEKKIIIKYRDSDHTYWTNEDKRLTGVNSFLGKFGFKFDREYWLLHKALSNSIPNFWGKFFSKYDLEDNKPSPKRLIALFQEEIDQMDSLAEAVAEVSDSWEMSNINGTKFHLEREEEAYREGYIVNPFTMRKQVVNPKPVFIPNGYDNSSLYTDLYELEDGVHLELICHSLKHLICGQADEVFIETIDGIRYVDIGDHKTNRKKPKMQGKETCMYPIDHLIDCTMTKYQLQLSLYAYMLELAGFVIRNIGIYHYQNYDVNTKNVMRFKYLGKECKLLLDFWEDFGMSKSTVNTEEEE